MVLQGGSPEAQPICFTVKSPLAVKARAPERGRAIPYSALWAIGRA